jgi:hypothetical protein
VTGPEHFSRIERIYHDALLLAVGDRPAFIEAACA